MKNFVFALCVCVGLLAAVPVLADSITPTTFTQGVSAYILVSCPTAGGSNVVANIFSSSGTSTPIDRTDNALGTRCHDLPHVLTVPGNIPAGTYYVDVYSTDFIIQGAGETKSAVESSLGFVESLPFTVVGTTPVTSAPSATGIVPSSGSTLGGTGVTVTGTGFTAGATVTIGGAAATGVTVSADGTSITALTPAGVAGASDVVVTNSDTGTATLSGAFTYTAPVVPTPTPTPTPSPVPVPVVSSSGGGSNSGSSTPVQVFTAPLLNAGTGLNPGFLPSPPVGQVLGASTVAVHSNGALVLDGQTVYLIQNGQRYAFRSADEFKTYGYSFDEVVPANSQDEGLPLGVPNVLKAKQGSVVLDASDGRTVYLIGDGGTKRGFASVAIFTAMGYSFAGLPVIDLSDYPSGDPITA